MAETTEQYRNRINQLKTSIENEPYIKEMREDIAEGISTTGNRQADIEVRQDKLEDDFVAVQQDARSNTPSGAELAVAAGEYNTLGERLGADEQKVAAQLANKVEDERFLNTQLTLSEPQFVTSRAYRHYQAIVNKPVHDLSYTQEAVAIYASFQQGECQSENHLKVFDENNVEIPFQIEATKDTKTGENLGTHTDGSMKFVTIWVLLDVNTSRTLTVIVYNQAQENNFTEKVSYVSISTSREEFQIGTSAITFEQSPNWQARRLIINGTDMTPGLSLTKAVVIDNTLTDINADSPGTVTFLKKNNTGNGVVFREHTTRFAYVYNDGIEVTQKTRLFANRRTEIETTFNITKDIPSGVFGGFLAKINWSPISGATNIQHDFEMYAAQETDSKQILAGHYDLQSLSSELQSGYPTTWSVSGRDGRVQLGMEATSQANMPAIPAGAFFSVRQYLSFNYGKGSLSTTESPEAARRMNRIVTRITSLNEYELKRKFINLAKRHIENLYHWDSVYGESYFYGLQGLESIAAGYLLGYSGKMEEALSRLNQGLSQYYAGGTRAGFYDAWYNGRGIEFIGREMSVLEYLLNTVERERITGIIHNLADAFVDMESRSGGGGKVYLRWSSTQNLDNLNAEATAVKFLALSLSLSEHQTRRDCMNRIIGRFLGSIEFMNRAPYSKAADGNRRNSLVQPTIHYHAFCYFDFFDAVHRLNLTGLTLPSVRQYAMEGTTAAGQIKEIGYQYNTERRGLASTNLYIAGTLVRYGGTISDLEHACQLLEHVISKSLPTGHHEHPIDGWETNVGERAASSAIEAQILIETVFELLA